MDSSQADKLVSLYSDGASAVAAAREVGVGYYAAVTALKSAGVYRPNNPPSSDLTDEEQDLAIELYYDGKSLADIMVALGRDGRPHGVVYSALARRGLPTRNPRKNPGGGRGGGSSAIGSTSVDRDGYVRELVGPDWKFLGAMRGAGGNGRWVQQHRKVMAEQLDRPLLSTEQVHHKNCDRSDNRPENLQLVVSGHVAGSALRCRSCGSQDIEHEPV